MTHVVNCCIFDQQNRALLVPHPQRVDDVPVYWQFPAVIITSENSLSKEVSMISKLTKEIDGITGNIQYVDMNRFSLPADGPRVEQIAGKIKLTENLDYPRDEFCWKPFPDICRHRLTPISSEVHRLFSP